ncbi:MULTISPECIES: hypothetical protein [Bacillus subtilis group]|uniref:hypothetical protein n=1 Tax=Bacillus TaxID=1386 RepID=UPI00020596EE|nr:MULTISPECIES: hypothetical protein [Bacillus subtilis group]AEB23390.1 hypothetical protein BAMTA208_06075 [Bacillus amyloliquefaciens TA208]AIW34148.1 hypothetical protein KS08_11035 [Bacillus subtilis]MBW8280074.1 hypothetical protein [Bacillus amyloliquefaciens]MEC0967064.1 hypothetical protein [Bacillus amyloliquefaciens]MEC1832858.1 hypothetical protein [Bacillus amyloliquefaciens]
MSIKIKLNTNSNNKSPYHHSTLKERLIKDKAVDMKDNYRIIDLNNGFVKVEPIDKNKLIK